MKRVSLFFISFSLEVLQLVTTQTMMLHKQLPIPTPF
jgi:hypothetical protein